MTGIRPDITEEGLRVAEAAEEEGLDLRLLGGVAIKVRAKDGLHPAFEREYADLDWIASRASSSGVQKLFANLGYSPQTRFNAINGRERLLFMDEENRRQVDVFVGAFRMSHQIPFGKRLAIEPVTIPLAELLLTKLQIIELNEKDVRDSLAILHNHPVDEDDGDAINARRVAELCASDWGLWRTITANLQSTAERAGNYELPEGGEGRIADRVRDLLERIDEEPKTFGWKVRSKIGERRRWYELPEEVDGGP
jgi:hypothetical protein